MNETCDDKECHVQRIDTFTDEQFEEIICSSTPVVFTNYVSQWPAFTRWRSREYLVEKVGKDCAVPIRTKFNLQSTANGKDPSAKQYNENSEWLGEEVRIPFGSFLDEWWQEYDECSKKDRTLAASSAETQHYLASLPISKHFPALEDDVIVPTIPKRQKKAGNLWIGYAGQTTPVHYDFSTGDPGMDGLHAVLLGRKKFRLYDPQYNAKFFPRKHIWGRFHQALVGANGLPEDPIFANARCLEIDLKEGEMLFIPKLWWHHVVTLEPSISVNFWFQHLGSEKLKLTRHWVVMEEYLKTVETMEITKEKMRNVLQFYGMKVTDEDVEFYMKNVHQFMLLPQFINTFANGTRAPWIKCEEAEQFGKALCTKVRQWIEARIANKEIQSVN